MVVKRIDERKNNTLLSSIAHHLLLVVREMNDASIRQDATKIRRYVVAVLVLTLVVYGRVSLFDMSFSKNESAKFSLPITAALHRPTLPER